MTPYPVLSLCIKLLLLLRMARAVQLWVNKTKHKVTVRLEKMVWVRDEHGWRWEGQNLPPRAAQHSLGHSGTSSGLNLFLVELRGKCGSRAVVHSGSHFALCTHGRAFVCFVFSLIIRQSLTSVHWRGAMKKTIQTEKRKARLASGLAGKAKPDTLSPVPKDE